MTGLFLQVRLDSSRLPNKALLELGGGSVIEHAMRSLRRVPTSVHAILTDQESADLLQPRAARCGFETFVGPRENVLERYVLAARYFGTEVVVRATGDNPLVSWELARLAVKEFRSENADYFGFDGPPLGTGVEVVATSALERAIRETNDPYDLEHVTSFVYRNPSSFRAVRRSAPAAYCLPKARVTLDTALDYAQLSRIFDALFAGSPISAIALVDHLAAQKTRTERSSEYHDNSSRA